jgi:hypothetical protein
VRASEVLRAAGSFLGFLALVAAEIGLILVAVGPLFSAGYETTTNVLVLVGTIALLATAPSALAAKILFARTLFFWAFSMALSPEDQA